jgi:hypothetical protein
MASLGFTDVVGLVGVAAYVTAHFAVQVLHKPPAGAFVVRLNLVGPICIMISLMGAFNLASFLSQFFWFALTLLGWWKNVQAGRLVAEAPSAPRPGRPANE